MRRNALYSLVLLLLVSSVFCSATLLAPEVARWSGRTDSDNVLKVLFGEGRRLFANHFFVKADVYFHSGYYPSIFDQSQAPRNSRHMTSQEGSPEEEEHERQMNFLGQPKDPFDAFGRHFMITEHTHLAGGNEREILPWLRLSAELDPQRIDTYTVSAYWLRVRLGKVQDAESFLREGLRNNPDSYEILFELGSLYRENYHDNARARNVWELALRKWMAQSSAQKSPEPFELEKITVNLARLEEEEGNFEKAVGLLEVAKKVSPQPQVLQPQIDALKQKLSASPHASASVP